MFLVRLFQRLAVGAGVGIAFRVIGHVFPSADVCSILLLFLLFMIAGLDEQLRPVFSLEPTIVFLAFVPGIYHYFSDLDSFIGFIQLLHEGNQGMHVVSI